ncbi:MAG: hypothetical protein U0V87_14220 [Acidobacteriota bacterium]
MTRRSLFIIRSLWIVATAALAALWRIEALVFLVPLAFIGPVVSEVLPCRDVDERERNLDYHASHLALMAVYLLVFGLFCRAVFVLGSEPNELYLLLAVPLLVRAVIAIGRGRGGRRLGLVLGFVFSAVWLTFTLLSHGISWESLGESVVGGVILLGTLLALRWPRIGGGVLFLAGLAFLVFVRAPFERGQYLSALLMMATLALPPMIAGTALFVSRGSDPDDEFEDLRGSSSTL